MVDLAIKGQTNDAIDHIKRKRIPSSTLVAMKLPIAVTDLILTATTTRQRDRLLVNVKEKLVLEVENDDSFIPLSNHAKQALRGAWEKWVSKDKLVKAAKRVRITDTGLNLSIG